MKKNLLISLSQEKNSLLLFSPFFLALGVMFYFSLENEPKNYIYLLIAVCILIGFCSCFFIQTFRPLILFIVLIFVGFLVAKIRTDSINIKFLKKEKCFENLTGIVSEISNKENCKKLIVNQGNSSIKIVVRTKANPKLEVGDEVVFSACLAPPSGAITPFGYDFAKFAYFEGISATGFATSTIEITKKYKKIKSIGKVREKIYKNLQNNMSKESSEVAAALIVGKKDGIKKEILKDFRHSGTAHLLAISGLHMSLVSLIFFSTLRSAFALCEYVTLRFDIKKISAFAAIICGFFICKLLARRFQRSVHLL